MISVDDTRDSLREEIMYRDVIGHSGLKVYDLSSAECRIWNDIARCTQSIWSIEYSKSLLIGMDTLDRYIGHCRRAHTTLIEEHTSHAIFIECHLFITDFTRFFREKYESSIEYDLSIEDIIYEIMIKFLLLYIIE